MASRRNASKKGLQFTVMIVGSMGLGKSTFVNTLCGLRVIEKRKMGGNGTMEIVPYTVGKHTLQAKRKRWLLCSKRTLGTRT